MTEPTKVTNKDLAKAVALALLPIALKLVVFSLIRAAVRRSLERQYPGIDLDDPRDIHNRLFPATKENQP